MSRRKSESRVPPGYLSAAIRTPIKTANFLDLYTLSDKELGRGKFAVVRKCFEKCSGREYAAKFLKKRRRGQDCRADIIQEIAVLELAKPSSRIADLHEVYETGHEIILVLEYAAGGEIFNLCLADGDEMLSENEVIRLLRQILEGVHFLHQNNLVHLDLKPQNILLSSIAPLGDVKIVDFGLSRKLGHAGELREIMGTPEYVAPEILSYEPITLTTDLWSIGVISYMLLTGESPFLGADKQETYLNVSQVNVDYSEETFSSVSDLAVDFIKTLLVRNPEDRATTEACLSHPWLQQGEPPSPMYTSGDRTVQSDEQMPKSEEPKPILCCNDVFTTFEDKENIPDDSSIACKRFRFDYLCQHTPCF
ncbi:serine/threonine-protein kinase 17B [Ambystoma mexicanum]|uniref:serine/threonine-protein kinase 17B n=1 Tax=Ambystoma mexicanum TaxID=8296 RepID=UPI0037E73049